MSRQSGEILAAWAICGLAVIGMLSAGNVGGPAPAVGAGVQLPGRGISAASGLSVEDEFADGEATDVDSLTPGKPSLPHDGPSGFVLCSEWLREGLRPLWATRLPPG